MFEPCFTVQSSFCFYTSIHSIHLQYIFYKSALLLHHYLILLIFSSWRCLDVFCYCPKATQFSTSSQSKLISFSNYFNAAQCSYISFVLKNCLVLNCSLSTSFFSLWQGKPWILKLPDCTIRGFLSPDYCDCLNMRLIMVLVQQYLLPVYMPLRYNFSPTDVKWVGLTMGKARRNSAPHQSHGLMFLVPPTHLLLKLFMFDLFFPKSEQHSEWK